jgi:hypothetical protein
MPARHTVSFLGMIYVFEFLEWLKNFKFLRACMVYFYDRDDNGKKSGKTMRTNLVP